VLVPLTSSLYVPGKLSDVENVVVDVGTGYYIKKVSYSWLSPSIGAFSAPILPCRPESERALTTDQSRGRLPLQHENDICPG